MKKLTLSFLFRVLPFTALLVVSACHPMKQAKPFSVNDFSLDDHLLIATQGSPFKDSLVATVISKLNDKPMYIEVMDISGLDTVQIQNWDVILIINTIHVGKPTKEAESFISKLSAIDRIIAVTTSESEMEAFPEVDGISSASKIQQIPEISSRVAARIRAILNN